MRRSIAICLVLAACGGGASSDGGPRPGFGSGGTDVAGDASAVLETVTQTRLVLTDADLPADLRYLVVGLATSTGSSEPPFFPTGEWVIGVAETYRPATLATQVLDVPGLRDTDLSIRSGTMALSTTREADDVYRTGLSAARSDGARVVRLDGLGDAAALIESGSEHPVRQVIVRRGAVLVSVVASAASAADLPEEETLTDLAVLLDVRTRVALDTGLDEPEAHPLLFSSPALQLNTYEFTLESVYAFRTGDQTITMTGRFEAPNEQSCTVSVDGRRVFTVIGDGIGLATEQADGWRYLDEQSADQIAGGCLGSNTYFEAALEMFDEASYIGFDEGFVFDVETVNGVETRRYGIQDVSYASLFEEVGRLDIFDIWFDSRDGWPVRLRIAGIFSNAAIRGPGILGTDDGVPTTITIDIERPDDPSITVDVPEDIGAAVTGV